MEIDFDWRLLLDFVDVLAWPVVVVVVVTVFRTRLRELMGRITEAEGVGFRAQFAEARARAADPSTAGHIAGPAHEVPSDEGEDPELPGHEEAPRRPARLESSRAKIVKFNDLVEGYHLLSAYDEVLLDLSAMSSEVGKTSAQMWALGLEMGSRIEGGLVTLESDDLITLRRVDEADHPADVV